MCSLRELYVTSFKDFQRGAQQGILGSRHAIHVAHEQLHQPALDSNCCKRLEENWTNECSTTLSPSEVLKSRSPINLSSDTPESHVLPLHTASQECLMIKARIYCVRCSCYPDQAFVCLSIGDKHAGFRSVSTEPGERVVPSLHEVLQRQGTETLELSSFASCLPHGERRDRHCSTATLPHCSRPLPPHLPSSRTSSSSSCFCSLLRYSWRSAAQESSGPPRP